MTAREQAIEAGAEALERDDAYCIVHEHGASQSDPQLLWLCPDCSAAAVIDAAAPIIRADERGVARRECLDDLRARVRLLSLSWSDTGGYHWVRQDHILALLGEAQP